MTVLSVSRKSFAASLLLVCNVAFGASADRMHDAITARVPSEFMGSILAEHNGEVLLNEGYGQANLEWNISNSPTTKFRIASITKQFTAAAILLLEEKGALSIEDSIADYVEDPPESWSAITIYHLLTHTSGIPDLPQEEHERFLPLTPSTFQQTLEKYSNLPLDSVPGEQYRYSNFGYMALGEIIEKTSGQPYADFLQQNVFDKLGMENTGYDTNARIIPGRASGYKLAGESMVNADYIEMSLPRAAGSLYSTTEDLQRWNRALHAGDVVSHSSVTRMTTAYKGEYGFGFIEQNVLGNRKVWHNGSINGFNSVLAYYPQADATIIVLSNLEGGAAETLARELEYIVLDLDVVLPSEWSAVSLSETELAEFVGTYEYREGLQMKFRVEEGQLISDTTGGQVLPLTPADNMVFYPQTPYIRWEFKRNADGKIDRLEYFQMGRTFTLTRL